MILECPKCETRYEIPAELPPEGRKVRCASCQHIWIATVENQPKPDLSPDIFDDGEIVFKSDDELTPEPPDETGAETEADAGNSQDSIDDMFAQDTPAEETSQVTDDDAGNSQNSIDDIFAQDNESAVSPDAPDSDKPSTEAEIDNDAFADDPSEAEGNFSEKAMEEVFSSAIKESDTADESSTGEDVQEADGPPIVIGKARKRRRFVSGNIAAGWAVLALLLCGVSSYVYYGRVAVVRMLPGTAKTYARLGLPVNVRGLEFEKIKFTWETGSGGPILEVFGDIVNVTDEPLKVPTVVFGLRTKEKVVVYQWAADVRSELLPGGQRTAFSAQIPTPPKSIRDVQVRFAKVR